MSNFQEDIRSAINRASRENGSDTPDKNLRDLYEAELQRLGAQHTSVVEAGNAILDRLDIFTREYGSMHDEGVYDQLKGKWDAALKLSTPIRPVPTDTNTEKP